MIADSEVRSRLFRTCKVRDVMIVHLADSVDSLNFIELLENLSNITTEHSSQISAVLLNFVHVGFLQSTAWNRVVDFATTCEPSGISVLACNIPSVFQSLAANQNIVRVYADEEAALSSPNDA